MSNRIPGPAAGTGGLNLPGKGDLNLPRKVVYVTGTRADYGLMKNNLRKLEKDPGIELCLIVTGNHLHPFFLSSLEEIENDVFNVYGKIDTLPETDDFKEVPVYIGKTILELQKAFREIGQNFTILLGDRPEMLAAAIASAFMNIPIIHLGGGHVSGNIDDSTRHAISKLSHIHLPSSEECAERLVRMGEERWRVHTVSASGVESIRENAGNLPGKKEVFDRVGFDPDRKLYVVLHHPVDNEEESMSEIAMIMETVKETGTQILFLYSNLDPGGRHINNFIEDNVSRDIRAVRNLEHETYLGLLKHADLLMGNSSSGIIEAPSLKTAFINIGGRQKNREFASNVIHVDGVEKKHILSAIEKSQSDSFIRQLEKCRNPYDNGSTAGKLVSIVKSTRIDRDLLIKGNAF